MKWQLLFLSVVIASVILYLAFSSMTEQGRLTSPSTANSIVSTKARVYNDCFWRFRNGWNHFSFCVNRTNYTINHTFSEIDGDYRFVLRWNTGNQEFDVYSPLSSQNTFDELVYNESFFVLYTSQEEYLQDTEAYFEDVAVSLDAAWNAAPYPFEFPANISTIDPYLGDYRFILKWNTTTQKFDVYSPLSSENTVTSIGVGDGYMVYLNMPYLLTYAKSVYPR